MKKKFILIMILALALSTMLLGACDKTSPMAADRQWLAEQTDTFMNMYKVAYDRIYTLQGSPHPCVKGHKANEAALFHAVLSNLHSSYKMYRTDVDKKLGQMAIEDIPCKNTLAIIEMIAKPFASMEDINNCGKVDAATAKAKFFLQAPTEGFAAIKTLRESKEM